MRSLNLLRPVLLAGILLTCGCSDSFTKSDNKGKIEGTMWSSLASTVKGRAIPAGFLQVDFRKDGTMVYRVGPQTFSGTYSIGSGDQVTFKFEQPLAGRKNHLQQVVINNDRLTITDTDGTQMTFQKTN